MKTRVHRVLSLCGLVLAAVAGGAPTAAPMRTDTDPMQWTDPAIEPDLPVRMNHAAYEKAFATALKNIDPDLAAGGPASGIVILEVAEDSQASLLGLAVGDVLTTLDGHPLHSDEQFSALRNKATDDQMFRVWSKTNHELHLVTVHLGTIGITTDEYLRLDRQYILTLPKGQKPVDEIVVAAECAASNPKLALAALSHAREAGEKSPMIDQIAAMACFSNLEFEQALAFGSVAMKAMPETAWMLAPAMRIAALATFRLKMGLDLSQKYPDFLIHPVADDHSDEAIKQLIDGFAALPAVTMDNPVAEFSKLNPKDQTSKLIGGKFPDAVQSDENAKILREHHGEHFEIPDAHYSSFAIGPAAANIDFSVTCTCQPMDDHHSEWGKTFLIALSDQISQQSYAELEIYDTGSALVYGPGHIPLYRLDLTPAVMKGNAFKVRLCAVGDRCEIVFNDARIFYAPILVPEENRELIATCRWQGIKGDFKDTVLKTASARKL